MNLLNILKECEPNISQIGRDAGVSRQAVYLWTDGHLPSKEAFTALQEQEKYSALLAYNYDDLEKRPVGRPKGSRKVKAA